MGGAGQARGGGAMGTGAMFGAPRQRVDPLSRLVRVAEEPPPPPDLTEQAIRLARLSERRRQAAGGRRSTFLSGALGASGAASTTVQRMLGS